MLDLVLKDNLQLDAPALSQMVCQSVRSIVLLSLSRSAIAPARVQFLTEMSVHHLHITPQRNAPLPGVAPQRNSPLP